MDWRHAAKVLLELPLPDPARFVALVNEFVQVNGNGENPPTDGVQYLLVNLGLWPSRPTIYHPSEKPRFPEWAGSRFDVSLLFFGDGKAVHPP